MAAICPKCGTAIDRLVMQRLPAQGSSANDHAHAIAFCCGSCESILAVQLDSATVGQPPTGDL